MEIAEWLGKRKNQGVGVITGASSGIGKGYLEILATFKMPLIAVSENQTELEQTIKLVQAKSPCAITPYVCDLRDEQQVLDLCAYLQQQNISVLINNAGIGMKGSFESKHLNQYRDLIVINALSPVLIARAVYPQFIQRNEGLMIHVSSINSLSPIPYNQVYTATKALVSSFANALSFEAKDTEIIFQLLLPGTTDTPFHVKQGANPSKLVMHPDAVARISLSAIGQRVVIPNWRDRYLPFLVRILPTWSSMNVASKMVKDRLGLT